MISHPCTPSLVELKQINRDLFSAESTPENMKKLEAIEYQIERAEREIAE